MKNNFVALTPILILGGILRVWNINLDGNIEQGLSVLLGVFIVYLIYILSANLFSAFILAVNPWAILLSQGSLWINVWLVALLFTAILILKPLANKKVRLVERIRVREFAYLGLLTVPLLLVTFPLHASEYFSYFSARFLFFGENYSHGVMLLTDLPLLSMGVVYFLREQDLGKLLILLWLLIAPLPEVLLQNQIGIGLTASFVLPLAIFSGHGAKGLWSKMTRLKFVIYFGVISYAFGVIYFLDNFFVHMSK